MKPIFSHEIDYDPQPEDAGTIEITAAIFGQYDNSRFTTVSLAKDFIDDEHDDCKSKEDLNYFLEEAGLINDVIWYALTGLILYVDEVTCPASSEYSPDGCALKVRLDLVPDYLDDDDDSHSQIQEALQVSFDDTSNLRFRPASKLAIKSLTRKVYNKKIMTSSEGCTICLQEFRNGGIVVALSCGHEFDEECIIKWLQTSHVCPLCRLELPCEDECSVPKLVYEIVDLTSGDSL